MFSSAEKIIVLLSLINAFTAEAWAPKSIAQTRQSSFASQTLTFLSSSADNNIVLSPSDDPDAFDNLKVGSAKIHRYSLDTDPDSNTEYVMWYHGR